MCRRAWESMKEEELREQDEGVFMVIDVEDSDIFYSELNSSYWLRS